MQSSKNLSKTTSLGLHYQLSQAKLLFRALTTNHNLNTVQLSRIKTIVLNKVRPFIENQQLIPGLTTGLRTVLNQVSDDDIIKFLLEMEIMVGDVLDEIGIEEVKKLESSTSIGILGE